MKALAAALLALLLSRPPGTPARPGSGHTQGEEDEDQDRGLDYDEDYDEEDSVEAGSRDTGRLRCYSCQSLHRGEGCNQTQSCTLSQTFCKSLTAKGKVESGPLTTYSAWCADTCEPLTRMAEGTLMTMSCCQTTLCNTPPWQGLQESGAEDPWDSEPGDPQDNGAGGPRGGFKTMASALLLSLLPGLWELGS